MTTHVSDNGSYQNLSILLLRANGSQYTVLFTKLNNDYNYPRLVTHNCLKSFDNLRKTMVRPETGFCMKCKSNVSINNPRIMTMKNGRQRVAGVCSNPGCDGRISKIFA